MIRSDELPYEERRNPNLPWGYWIVIDADGSSSAPLIDDQGRRWHSLREALWVGRLGMIDDEQHAAVNDEQVEFLLAVLSAIDRTVVSVAGMVTDMFNNNWINTAHYAAWLGGQGLIEAAHSLTNAKLTPEGRAILVMLAATRKRELATLPTGLPSLHPFARLRPEPDQQAMSAAIAAAEAALPVDIVRFMRKDTAKRPAIVLVGAANARLPMAETHWSISFAEGYQRDRFYLWLLAHADRWSAWLDIARQHRDGSLTEHLLALFVAQDCEERGI